MNHLVDIVVAKDGQFRYRVADSIVSLVLLQTELENRKLRVS